MEKDSPSGSSAPPQLQSTLMVTSLNLPQVSGSTPTIASVCDQKALEKIEDALEKILRGNRNSATDEWVESMCELAKKAIAFRDPELMLGFARGVKDKLGIVGPKTGAFWSDKTIGQEQARNSLIDDDSGKTFGQVLADSELGKLATKFGIPPQGPSSKGGVVNETLEKYHERTRVALLFWGAVSKLYTEGLQGEVHVWLPKGLTMGSIFWNDELPTLHKLLKEQKISELWFHVRDDKGDWSDKLPFEKMSIVDAYLMDASGVNKGADSLRHEIEPSRRATLKPHSYEITLGTPIRIATLKSGFENALARARARLAQSGDGAATKQ